MFYALVPVVAIVGFVAFVSSKPSKVIYKREAFINAAPDRVFELIEDLHKWTSWSPWEGRDPEMKRTYSGAEYGAGAIYEWNGNNKVGQGRMEILNAEHPSAVKIKLDFIKPFEGHNISEFSLVPKDSGTQVTWTMTGDANFMSKMMSVFIDMDKMLGNDFELGLANLNREVNRA